MRLYHGGAPGLLPGAIITPQYERPALPGCAICAARFAGTPIVDPLAMPGMVYATTNRLYALHYASLYGRGDLYRVEMENPVRSTEDTVESYRAPSAVVVAVLTRAALLTMSERRRLMRMWADADHVHAAGGAA